MNKGILSLYLSVRLFLSFISGELIFDCHIGWKFRTGSFDKIHYCNECVGVYIHSVYVVRSLLLRRKLVKCFELVESGVVFEKQNCVPKMETVSTDNLSFYKRWISSLKIYRLLATYLK